MSFNLFHLSFYTSSSIYKHAQGSLYKQIRLVLSAFVPLSCHPVPQPPFSNFQPPVHFLTDSSQAFLPLLMYSVFLTDKSTLMFAKFDDCFPVLMFSDSSATFDTDDYSFPPPRIVLLTLLP